MAAIVHDVPDWTWAGVAQPSEHDPDATCGLAKGGSVETLGSHSKFGTLLRYTPPANARGGTECKAGMLVLLPIGRVDGWPQKGEVARQMDDDEASRDAWIQTVVGKHQ